MTIRSATTRTTATALSIAATITLLAAPAISHAESERARSDKAMDTCIAAFVAATLPKEQPVSVRKEGSAASPLDSRNHGYKIVLTATGATSGKRLAKGTCIIDRAGTVIALNGKALPAQLVQAEVSATEKTAAR